MKILIIAVALFGFLSMESVSHAEETVGEKVNAVGKDATRAIKKGVNRVEEGLCGELTGDSKVSCMAKKAKNRAVESKDAIVDKGSEVKNAVDSGKE